MFSAAIAALLPASSGPAASVAGARPVSCEIVAIQVYRTWILATARRTEKLLHSRYAFQRARNQSAVPLGYQQSTSY